jgi:excisionase family DNA binding protein
MGTSQDDCLTAPELAERLRVKPSTVLDWQRAGRIPSIRSTNKVLRFNLKDVMAALKPPIEGKGVSQ